jgi:hypothetical protein
MFIIVIKLILLDIYEWLIVSNSNLYISIFKIYNIMDKREKNLSK